MAQLTEFQKKRLENIKRNNDLLKKLNLSGISTQLKREAGVADDPLRKKKKATTKKKVVKTESKPARLPTRRSRRLRGETVDGQGIPNLNDNQLLKMNSPDSSLELDEIKSMPIIGDVKQMCIRDSYEGMERKG